VNSGFIDFIREYMQSGGDLFFATDFEDYGLDVAEMMTSRDDFANMLAPDRFRHALEGYHLSKYMLKFMAEGKNIHFVHYRKL
jgi:tRNA (guanine-N7-)-methyltransferase